MRLPRRSVMKPAFYCPPSIVGDKFLFAPIAPMVILPGSNGMSGEPMARVPGLMPWLGEGGAIPK